jgi:hypothetical protein
MLHYVWHHSIIGLCRFYQSSKMQKLNTSKAEAVSEKNTFSGFEFISTGRWTSLLKLSGTKVEWKFPQKFQVPELQYVSGSIELVLL